MKLAFGNPRHKRIGLLIAENKKMQDKIDKNKELIKFLIKEDGIICTSNQGN